MTRESPRAGRRLRRRGLERRGGFALLAVIWGVGIISLLVIAFMTSGRLRLQSATNIAGATQASLIAEGVVNIVALSLLAARDQNVAEQEGPVNDGAPRFCVFEGAAIAVGIEEEGGKVDINAASPEILKAMLLGLGLDMRAADAVANAIVAFRSAPTETPGRPGFAADAGDKPIPPKRALFQTVMELDQVSGVDAALFRELTPLVTVHSHSPGVDARSAPPALFAAMTGLPSQEVRALAAAPFPNRLNRKDPRFPANFNQRGDRNAFLVHVEALLATGQTAARSALVDLGAGLAGQQFAIREMRRGRSLYVDRLSAMIASNGAGVPDC